MSNLLELKPSKKKSVIECLKEAGIKIPKNKNRYFLSLPAFNQPKIVVLNFWYEDQIIQQGKDIIVKWALPTNSHRMRKVQEAIKSAIEDKKTIRILVLDGKPAKKGSKVLKRALDPVPWSVKSYSEKTGMCVLLRDVNAGNGLKIKKPYLATVQFKPTANQEDLEEETRIILQTSITEKPKGQKSPKRVEITSQSFERDPEVRAFVLSKAEGRCDLCIKHAPFINQDGSPFLEVHHVKQLADGGSDKVENAVAVCPNCHRSLHQAKDFQLRREKF